MLVWRVLLFVTAQFMKVREIIMDGNGQKWDLDILLNQIQTHPHLLRVGFLFQYFFLIITVDKNSSPEYCRTSIICVFPFEPFPEILKEG